jgi:hypothetical protein
MKEPSEIGINIGKSLDGSGLRGILEEVFSINLDQF